MKISDIVNEGLPDPLMGKDDPVIVVYNQQGKPIDRLALSVAATKYKFNPAQAKLQFKHQDKVRMGNITLSAPIAGQPTKESLSDQVVEKTFGDVTIRSSQADNEGSFIEVIKNGKTIAAGYYDLFAGDFVVNGISFDSMEELAAAWQNDLSEEETYSGNEFYEAYGDLWFCESGLYEAEYQGRKVPLGKPMRGDVKKFKVYVKNPKGNVVKVNFGDPDMKIKKSNPARRKSFRARHNCDNPGPRHKARYWSCRKW